MPWSSRMLHLVRGCYFCSTGVFGQQAISQKRELIFCLFQPKLSRRWCRSSACSMQDMLHVGLSNLNMSNRFEWKYCIRRRRLKLLYTQFQHPASLSTIFVLSRSASSTSATGNTTARTRATEMPARREKLVRLALGSGAAGASLRAAPGDAGANEEPLRGHVASGTDSCSEVVPQEPLRGLPKEAQV